MKTVTYKVAFESTNEEIEDPKYADLEKFVKSSKAIKAFPRNYFCYGEKSDANVTATDYIGDLTFKFETDLSKKEIYELFFKNTSETRPFSYTAIDPAQKLGVIDFDFVTIDGEGFSRLTPYIEDIRYPVRKISKTIVDRASDSSGLWYYIAISYKLDDDFLRKHQENLNWNVLSLYQDLSTEIMREFADELNWDILSKYKQFTPKQLEEFKSFINWNFIVPGKQNDRCQAITLKGKRCSAKAVLDEHCKIHKMKKQKISENDQNFKN